MLAVHGWTIHLTVFLAVSALLTFVWLLTTGSVDTLQTVVGSPADALDEGFWPIWFVAFDGCALLIHTGVAFSNGAFGFQARRRRRRRRRELQRTWDKTAKWAASMASAKLESKRSQSGAEVPAGTRQWVRCDVHRHRRQHAADRRAGRRHLAGGPGPPPSDGAGPRRRLRGPRGVDPGGQLLRPLRRRRHALRCAVAIQRSLAAERRGDDLVPETRMGLHAGEVVADDGGDLLGHVVNVASRVTGVATGGEILVTESVADLAPADVSLVDRGLETLKGVPQPRHLLAVKWEV